MVKLMKQPSLGNSKLLENKFTPGVEDLLKMREEIENYFQFKNENKKKIQFHVTILSRIIDVFSFKKHKKLMIFEKWKSTKIFDKTNWHSIFIVILHDDDKTNQMIFSQLKLILNQEIHNCNRF